eukprot:10480405-Lingulodinium_polyedra.AAC.1
MGGFRLRSLSRSPSSCPFHAFIACPPHSMFTCGVKTAMAERMAFIWSSMVFASVAASGGGAAVACGAAGASRAAVAAT